MSFSLKSSAVWLMFIGVVMTLCETATAFAPAGTSLPSFVTTVTKRHPVHTVLFESSETPEPALVSDFDSDDDSDDVAVPSKNPDRPELPELKGDFDWDEKFGDDADWITENVPGKVVLNDMQLAAQVAALGKLEDKWRKERLNEEYEDARILGWTNQAETYNGRIAMFFLVVGLLTEYWTGINFPGQIEEMLRVGGVIGFDG